MSQSIDPAGGGVEGRALPAEIADRLRAAGLVPVVEIEDAGRAVELAQALEAGGLPVAEITFRTAAAEAALRAIASRVPGLLLIAGTVTTPRQAEIAADAGARLLVAPGLNPRVVERAHGLGLPMMPGVCTPSEVEAAMALGLTSLKFFPAEPIGGLAYLKAISAPYRAIAWNPTGGIRLEHLPGYLGLPSVLACGGSWLAPAPDVAAGRFEAIRARAAEAVEAVRRVRPARAASDA